jgi:SOS regulatory protein LexA
VVLRPGKEGTSEKRIPLDAFFHKIVMIRDKLRVLEAKGALTIEAGAARGIRLTEGLGVPLVGRVAAGSPILAEAHIQARYQIDPALFRPRADYLLRVRGMSMRDVGILDGDLLAVHKTDEVRSGQVVVGRLACISCVFALLQLITQQRAGDTPGLGSDVKRILIGAG